MAANTYGRGQIEWALWCAFVGGYRGIDKVPKVFRTRIKRLLEIDRGTDLSNVEDPPGVDYAFSPMPSPESGDVEYSEVDVFCLAIGLDLLDVGFKQKEVVFLMYYLRLELTRWYPGMLAQLLPERGGTQTADRRLFVIIKKIELTEIAPKVLCQDDGLPVFLEPMFCEGVAALGKKLDDIMPNRRRAVTILELASTAQAVHSFLQQAPEIRRGRPRAI